LAGGKIRKKNGKGKYWWPDGSEYDGEWVDGERHGYGIMKWGKGPYDWWKQQGGGNISSSSSMSDNNNNNNSGLITKDVVVPDIEWEKIKLQEREEYAGYWIHDQRMDLQRNIGNNGSSSESSTKSNVKPKEKEGTGDMSLFFDDVSFFFSLSLSSCCCCDDDDS